MRDGFREIASGWLLIDDWDYLTDRIETSHSVRAEVIEECKQIVLRYEAHSPALVHLITDALETLHALAQDD
jgi:hypothetical protein